MTGSTGPLILLAITLFRPDTLPRCRSSVARIMAPCLITEGAWGRSTAAGRPGSLASPGGRSQGGARRRASGGSHPPSLHRVTAGPRASRVQGRGPTTPASRAPRADGSRVRRRARSKSPTSTFATETMSEGPRDPWEPHAQSRGGAGCRAARWGGPGFAGFPVESGLFVRT